MDICEVKECGQPTEFGVIYGGKRACPDCYLRHCDDADPLDFKKPGTFISGPAVLLRRPAARAVAAAGPGQLDISF